MYSTDSYNTERYVQKPANSWSTLGSIALIAAGAVMVLASSATTSQSAYGVAPMLQAQPMVTSSVSSRVPMELYGRGRSAGRMQKKMMERQGQPQKPPTPAVDPDNEEFVLFCRAKTIGTRWLPLTIVTGGTQANNLVKATQGTLATEMFKNQLIRSIGEVIYRDQPQIEKMIQASKLPGIGAVKEWEYGFKIRDKTNPEAWMDEVGIIVIPPKDQLPETTINKVAEGVRGLADKLGLGPKKPEEGK